VTIYKNPSMVDVGSPLAAQDTAAVSPAPGQPFRLRLNLGVDIIGDSLTAGSYKLMYYHTTDSCSDTATYNDITTSTPIKFYDNATVPDKSGLVINANDPTRFGVSAVHQSYNESNPSSVLS